MRSVIVVFAAFLAGTSVARADTVYAYTGNNYQSVKGFYDTTEHVSGSFEVATPLAADETFSPVAYTEYSFFDGEQTLTNLNSAPYTFSVTTDSVGNVLYWGITLVDLEVSQYLILIQHIDGVDPTIYASDLGFRDPFFRDKYDVYASYGQVVGDAGTWTLSETTATTPEPSAMLLFVTGALGFAGVVRRRVAKD